MYPITQHYNNKHQTNNSQKQTRFALDRFVSSIQVVMKMVSLHTVATFIDWLTRDPSYFTNWQYSDALLFTLKNSAVSVYFIVKRTLAF